MRPDAYYKDIYDIDYIYMKEKGIKNIFFDIDNTLIPYKTKNVDKKLIEFIDILKRNFNVFIISNGKGKRVNLIKSELNINGYSSSMKPLKKNYKKILKKYKCSECIFIGDQIMTDILGAKRMNMKAILVKPIDLSYEPVSTKIWRIFEKIYINKLKKKNLFDTNRYYNNI